MQRFVRAAGSAAVVLTMAASAAFADPTFASEAQVEQVVPYTAHAAATMAGGDLGIDSAGQPAQLSQDANPSTPVISHAVAPIAPEPAPAAAAPAAPPAAEPAERDGRSLAQLVRDHGGQELSGEDAECLARAVYWESNGEPVAGQLAVAEVIINRSRSGRFPSSICGVVRQRGQFSFVRGGHIPAPPRNGGWRQAVGVTHVALQDLADSSAARALFFHARRVSPGWRNLTRVATVGNHVFYR
jgi:spore germination cell wall hydrolase CwlJ-like protein